MVCLMEALGEPAEMAEAMKAAEEGDFTGLSQAGMECGLDMGPSPRKGVRNASCNLHGD